MKERPILFSAPMVRAILAGKKTRTRRVAKLIAAGHAKEVGGNRRWHPADPEAAHACPYGRPEDRLWVRETWAAPHAHDHIPPRMIQQDARIHYAATEDLGGLRLRSSIHMPRWASRITLEITGVRIERLHAISYADAIAEGLKGITKDGSMVKFGIPDRDGLPGTDNDGWPWNEWRISPFDAYKHLWERLNGPGSWKTNPLVWVLTFAAHQEKEP